MIKETYEELEARLLANQNEARAITNKLSEIESEKLIPETEQKYLGKYFKTRNSYSGKEKWFLYQKVLNITGVRTVDVFKFQTDIDGVTTITSKDFTYTNLLGEEISEDEFREAFSTVTSLVGTI